MDPVVSSPLPSFSDRLAVAVRRCRNTVCVGIDPRWESLPPAITQHLDGNKLSDRAQGFRDFGCQVIDAVKDLVPTLKPQAAFFEALGPAGMQALADVIAHGRAAGREVILDGKRNDIGTTAEAYAEAWLGRHASPWGSDALTVSPYLGQDTLDPFAKTAAARQAGIFVLVKTSNPGSAALQDLAVVTASNSTPYLVRQVVAEWVERLAAASCGECGYGDVGAVVGATYPRELSDLRREMPHAWLLVPGYGAQGGGADDVAGAFDAQGLGGIVNNSRGILFAFSSKEYGARVSAAGWSEACRMATEAMIQALRDRTTVGNL